MSPRSFCCRLMMIPFVVLLLPAVGRVQRTVADSLVIEHERYQPPVLPGDSEASSTVQRAVERYNEETEQLVFKLNNRWHAAQAAPLRALQRDLQFVTKPEDAEIAARIGEVIAAVQGKTAEPLSILATWKELTLSSRLAVNEFYDVLQQLDQEYRDTLQVSEDRLMKIMSRQLSLAQRRDDSSQVESLTQLYGALQKQPALRLLPAPYEAKRFTPGIYITEYAAAEEQLTNRLAFVPEYQLGRPQSVRVGEMDKTGAWWFPRERNGFARFYLKIDQPGEYAFTTYGFHSGSSFLVVQGKRISQAETRNGQQATLLTLERGMVPVESQGRIGNTAVRILWKGPGDSEMRPIPAELIYCERNPGR